jgi:hypothetical protein
MKQRLFLFLSLFLLLGFVSAFTGFVLPDASPEKAPLWNPPVAGQSTTAQFSDGTTRPALVRTVYSAGFTWKYQKTCGDWENVDYTPNANWVVNGSTSFIVPTETLIPYCAAPSFRSTFLPTLAAAPFHTALRADTWRAPEVNEITTVTDGTITRVAKVRSVFGSSYDFKYQRSNGDWVNVDGAPMSTWVESGASFIIQIDTIMP